MRPGPRRRDGPARPTGAVRGRSPGRPSPGRPVLRAADRPVAEPGRPPTGGRRCRRRPRSRPGRAATAVADAAAMRTNAVTVRCQRAAADRRILRGTFQRLGRSGAQGAPRGPPSPIIDFTDRVLSRWHDASHWWSRARLLRFASVRLTERSCFVFFSFGRSHARSLLYRPRGAPGLGAGPAPAGHHRAPTGAGRHHPRRPRGQGRVRHGALPGQARRWRSRCRWPPWSPVVRPSARAGWSWRRPGSSPPRSPASWCLSSPPAT